MTVAAEDRLLVLVRHSKAQGVSSGGDHERELTARGHRDAREIGRWLHEYGIGVDEVHCSDAMRTRQTCEGIWAAGCAETDVHHDGRIYDAGAQALLEVVHGSDADADVVMVVGHAPGIPWLTSLLADGQGSKQAHELLGHGFPTSGVAVLSYAGHWGDLGPEQARLERFHVARAT